MEGNSGNQGWQNNQSGQQPKAGLSWSQPSVASGKPPAQQQNKQMQPSKKSNKKTIGIIAAVVVVLALVAWAFSARRETAPSATNSMATTTATTTPTSNVAAVPTSDTTRVVVGNIASLTIPSPQDSGLEVAVSNIVVSVPTWIVVYESHNGQPGNALGASLFVAGRTSGVVNLLRGTLPGQTYFAGEAQDDGDHIFSLQNDPAIRDVAGNPVWVQFKTR